MEMELGMGMELGQHAVVCWGSKVYELHFTTVVAKERPKRSPKIFQIPF